ARHLHIDYILYRRWKIRRHTRRINGVELWSPIIIKDREDEVLRVEDRRWHTRNATGKSHGDWIWIHQILAHERRPAARRGNVTIHEPVPHRDAQCIDELGLGYRIRSILALAPVVARAIHGVVGYSDAE